jgi:hypothetical protein
MPDPQELVQEFAAHSGRADAAQVVTALAGGLGLLNDLVYFRLHDDVERVFGTDSMLMPVSESKSRRTTKCQIELYQIAESAAAAREFGYLPADETWYVPWLAKLRLEQSPLDPKHCERIEGYLSTTGHARQLALTDILALVLPESRRAPLVLFSLFPLAVQIVTALAFGDPRRAKQLRAAQLAQLPALAGCRQCRGRILESDQRCPACGNPLWETRWLVSVD